MNADLYLSMALAVMMDELPANGEAFCGTGVLRIDLITGLPLSLQYALNYEDAEEDFRSELTIDYSYVPGDPHADREGLPEI